MPRALAEIMTQF